MKKVLFEFAFDPNRRLLPVMKMVEPLGVARFPLSSPPSSSSRFLEVGVTKAAMLSVYSSSFGSRSRLPSKELSGFGVEGVCLG